MSEINYNEKSRMTRKFPEIKKLGACSLAGEMTPFVWNGKLMRLELFDPSHGLDFENPAICTQIIDVDSGEVISRFGYGSYYHAGCFEDGKAYVTAVRLSDRDTIVMYESRDLINWTERTLFRREGFRYFNTALTKGPDGYVLLMEASEPEALCKPAFTFFFAKSPDLINWEFMDDECRFSKERYNGGPYMKYSDGWYYVISLTALPCARYTNYIFRTKDFYTWFVGDYNPIIMPSNEDWLISPRGAKCKELVEYVKNFGYNSNNSDIDICDYNGKTYIMYCVGNQLGWGYNAEAEFDGTTDEFLKAYFEN